MMIHFLQNSEIDRREWDRCVSSSPNGLIYGMSWYLDLVSPGWCGLEQDGYAAVMPLPLKRKYGIQYVMQPVYAQQFGVYSKNRLSVPETEAFLNSIPQQFRYVALNLNSENEIMSEHFTFSMNNNFVLPLDSDYNTLSSRFSANTGRNLQKSKGLQISLEGSVDELLTLKLENTGSNRRRIPTQRIHDFINSVMDHNAGLVCTAASGGNTCAAVFFLRDEKRFYYLIPVSNPLGKEKKAMFAIVNRIIQEFAGSSYLLDFEGSNIPGIARFFEGFGAVNRPYPSLRINRMPFPLNKIIKP